MKNGLKRMLSLLMLSLLLPTLALGEIAEENGRLAGSMEATMAEYGFDGVLYFDCEIPMGFDAETWKLLSVEYRTIDEAAMLDALRTAGTDPKSGAIETVNTDAMNRWLLYAEDRDMRPTADPGLTEDALTAPQEGALAAVLRTLDALSIEADQPRMRAFNYDNPVPPYLYIQAKMFESQAAEARQTFAEAERAAGRDPSQYTVISARPALLGLPVSQALSYGDGDAREPNARVGIFSDINFIVRDDGQIVRAALSNIPQVIGEAPAGGEPRGWREVLDAALAQHDGLLQRYGDKPSENQHDEATGELWYYAMRCTVTAIDPCWVGVDRGELRPGWRFTVTETRADDGVFLGFSEYCVDAQTLEPVM